MLKLYRASRGPQQAMERFSTLKGSFTFFAKANSPKQKNPPSFNDVAPKRV